MGLCGDVSLLSPLVAKCGNNESLLLVNRIWWDCLAFQVKHQSKTVWMRTGAYLRQRCILCLVGARWQVSDWAVYINNQTRGRGERKRSDRVRRARKTK